MGRDMSSYAGNFEIIRFSEKYQDIFFLKRHKLEENVHNVSKKLKFLL